MQPSASTADAKAKVSGTNGAGEYLEQQNVIGLFEDLAATLLYYRPDRPLEFLLGVIKDRLDAEEEGIPLRNQIGTLDVSKLKRPVKQLTPLSDFSKVSSALPVSSPKKPALGNIRPGSPAAGSPRIESELHDNARHGVPPVARQNSAGSISTDYSAELSEFDYSSRVEPTETVSALSVFKRQPSKGNRTPRAHAVEPAQQDEKLSYKQRMDLLSEPDYNDSENDDAELDPSRTTAKTPMPGSPPRVVARPTSRAARPATKAGVRPTSRPLEPLTSKRQPKPQEADY